ncbi:MAG TPA: type 2 lanthipeptide synthetase LanM family protein [Thermoanaerobaculia bacterium]|nr:type 2 lanthipeptide synthetase LanM family protein [Thermoanaerobaculia bacterium]
MDEIFDAPDWLAALTLAERAALPDAVSAAPPPERLERAARHERRWRNETDLLDDPLFAERLALDGLTPERFRALLAEPLESLHRRAGGRPPWVEALAQAWKNGKDGRETGELGVLELLRPLIEDAYGQVLAGLQGTAPGLLDAEGVASSLLATLIKRLRWASERVLALELQASAFEGKLAGDTPEERFQSFVATLCQPAAALEILKRYPVLARDACRHAAQWVETSLEMMARFAADRGEIVRHLLQGEDPGALTAVETGLSDRHAGGRSVAILSFASGGRIVYKPKSLAVDRCFQALVAWLNERGGAGLPPLATPTALDRGTYGWVEHVAQRPCETPEEVERFHRRQGAWVALFYALEATDFHHENLIAAGEHPVPIDLETLFQPTRTAPAASGPGYLPTAHTVLNSGLLPHRFGATEAEAGLDLSGMGAPGGQKIELRKITGEGTDRMRWDKHETELPAGPNLPTLRGEPLPLWRHGESVLHGFRAMYRLLARHREELLAPAGPLAPFSGLPVRALLRGTAVYAHLLHVAHHPDYLQNALDQDRLYDRLWLDAVGYSPFRRTVRAERRDLAEGDVPRFETTTASTALLHPGDRPVEGFFATSGLDLVRSRLAAFSEEELTRQSWLVQASIEATRSLGEPLLWPATDLPELPEGASATPERFLAAARRLGDRLEQLAVVQGDFVTWFQLALRPDGWLLETMPADLYDGLSGIALFLAHLASLTGEERYERLARQALHTARQRSEAEPAMQLFAGAYSGWGGLVYALTQLGALWREPELLEAAEKLTLLRAQTIESDTAFDLIGGSAGAAAALLELYEHRPSAAILDLAARCGERLLATAVAAEQGIGWTIAGETQPLTGFSHGTAGIAWVLARLAHATGDERFRDAARGALRYERSWFDPARDSWPDLRHSHQDPEIAGDFLYAWCHGSPGIGLGRLAILPYLDSREAPEALAEVRAAVRSTLAEGFGGSQCLCHGDLGNLELVLEAGRRLGDEELTAAAGRLAARILARIESGGLRCGINPRTESLGLLVGLAGIGYGLLRAAWPERVPSVLLLEAAPAVSTLSIQNQAEEGPAARYDVSAVVPQLNV